MNSIHGKGLGWRRDTPDIRDFNAKSASVAKILAKLTPPKKLAAKLPTAVDLRQWCTPIEDQGSLGSCTAQAGVGMLEYFEKRATGNHLDASTLFLYKVTRQLSGIEGDDGAHLRDTMKAMALFGVPPERFWPYDESKVFADPSAFCFAFAQSYQAIEYYRVDPPSATKAEILTQLKQYLSQNLTVIFGFSVYGSMPPLGDKKGEIPFPERDESVVGGHAVLAVGYDDQKTINGKKGALLIRNSWSKDWGVDGYGWLPYEYVTSGLAKDFWTMAKAEYADAAAFQQ